MYTGELTEDPQLLVIQVDGLPGQPENLTTPKAQDQG
jgi:hypothetical protein